MKRKKKRVWIVNISLLGAILILLVIQMMIEVPRTKNQSQMAMEDESTKPNATTEALPEFMVEVTPAPTYEVKEEEPSPLPAKQPATILFGGDVLIYTAAIHTYDTGGLDALVDPPLAELMRQSDYTMVNQEFAFSTRGQPMEGKQYTFRSDPSYVKVFNELGIDMVTLANNHTLDYGTDALVDSCTTLEQAGIRYVGAGENLERAKQIEYVDVNGHRIAFIGASRVIPVADWNATSTKPGMLTTYDPTLTLEQIKIANENADYVFIYVHWGKERETMPEEYQRTMAKQYIDAGADAVIGSHSHCLQGIEYYEGKPIVYSLGNYIFGSSQYQTAVALLTVDGDDQVELTFQPCEASGGKTSLLTKEEEIKEFNSYMESISFGIKIDANQKVVANNYLSSTN